MQIMQVLVTVSSHTQWTQGQGCHMEGSGQLDKIRYLKGMAGRAESP